jgi:hypothetical protein
MAEPAESAQQEGAEEQAPAVARAPKKAGGPGVREFIQENARLLASLIFLATGIVLVLLGWYGAAHTNIATEQVPYLISGGLLGLGLIIVAGIMGVGALQERSNEDLRKEIVQAVAAMRTGMPDRPLSASDVSSNGHHVFVVPGGRSYHEAGCPILEGKEGVKQLLPAQASGSGYAACKLCGGE